MAAVDEIKMKVKQPTDCSEEELSSFKARILEGGEVEAAGFAVRLRLARVLAFGMAGDCVAAVAALKSPLRTYRERVFAKAAVADQTTSSDLELGWIFVAPEFRLRGLAARMVVEILGRYGQATIFATSRVDNVGMHKVLEANGFGRTGVPYKSERGRQELVLFLRRCG